jgi:hypothetical protein
MDESRALQPELLEQLQFRPRWWWDPVPPWLRDHLDVKVIQDLAVIQLEKRMRILEVEQIAVKETISALKGARG